MRELALRVRALLRRTHRTEVEADSIAFGRLRVDREAHRAWIDDAEVALTALEFRLLYTFLSRKGRVQTREALLSDVWGIDADVTTIHGTIRHRGLTTRPDGYRRARTRRPENATA